MSEDTPTASAPGGATPRQKKIAWTLLLCIGVSIAALDLWTKEVAFDALKVNMDSLEFFVDPDTGKRYARVEAGVEEIVFIEGIWSWEAAMNTGAFSGWFGNFTHLLAILSFVALLVIAWILFQHLRRPEGPDFYFIVALSLLWGGTLGNFYDRAVIGAVRDFIKWYYDDFVWPNFNIADSAICVGVAVMAVHILLDTRAQARQAAREST